MSVKLIAAAIVIAGGIGAVASYFQHSPDMFALTGPGAGSPETSSSRNGSGGEGYRLCLRDFRDAMPGKNLNERREACRCFDATYGTWDADTRKFGKALAHVAITQALMIKNSRTTINRIAKDSQRRPSQFEREIQRSQARDAAAPIRRNASKIVMPENQSALQRNPVSTLIMNLRVRALISRCEIIDLS